MRQMREIVRLHEAGVSIRQIGVRVGVAALTVRLTLQRTTEAGLSAGIALDRTDAALKAVLFSGAVDVP
jgi:IS30 family transposase